MKFENVRVYNFERALYGMRHPKESYHLSDSHFESIEEYLSHEKEDPVRRYIIGEKDMKLAQTLIRSGNEHRKFMRQIFVSVDITAPLYWWKEFDTYKVGTVANSTSTMHKIQSKPITIECFEIDDYEPSLIFSEVDTFIGSNDGESLKHYEIPVKKRVESIISFLEDLRLKYLETKDKRFWKELIRWTSSGWLQTRTVTLNYENLFAMCSRGQRRFHKLNEWSGIDDYTLDNFIKFARTLPYAQELIFIDEIEEE